MSINEILPKGWQHVQLLDLLDRLESGSRPKGGVKGILSGIPSVGGEHIDSNGEFKFENVRYVPESFADLMTRGLIEKGDVLVVKDGATTGKTSFVGASFPFNRAVVNEHVFLCRCSNQLNSKYVFLYLYSEAGNQQILEDFRGAAQGGISQRFAELVKVPLSPFQEQIRIVEKLEDLLSDLDAGVAELKAAQKKLVQYRQSLLKAAVEGTLTSVWRTTNQPKETGTQLLERILIERCARWEAKQLAKFKEQGKAPPKDWQSKYPDPVKPDTSDLPELPDGWVWASLDCLISDGPQNGIYLPASLYGSGTSILRIDDYQIGWHRSRENLNSVNADHSAVLTYSLSLGDLVINRVNSMTHLGKCLFIGKELVGALFESNMMRLHLSGNVSEIFVSLYLGSHIGRARLIKNAKWAVNQASINQEDVKIAPIPLPSFEEQVEISSVLLDQMNGLDAQLRTIEISLKQSAAQRKNILKTAFSGQLVPQDPNDEPASVLLERIRAEREQHKKQPKIKNPRKSTGMKKSDLDNVRNWIASKPDATTFNFSELRNSLPGDYEVLKDSIFQLLAEDKPIIEQVFDRETSALQFKIVKS